MGSIAGARHQPRRRTRQWVPVINTGLMRMLFAAGGDASDIKEEDIEEFGPPERSRTRSKKNPCRRPFDDKNFDFDGDHRRGHRRRQQAQHQLAR